MTSLLKTFTAAALTLALTTGAMAQTSTTTTVKTPAVHQTQTFKSSHKLARVSHRTHAAQLRRAHRLHVARGLAGHRFGKGKVAVKKAPKVTTTSRAGRTTTRTVAATSGKVVR